MMGLERGDQSDIPLDTYVADLYALVGYKPLNNNADTHSNANSSDYDNVSDLNDSRLTNQSPPILGSDQSTDESVQRSQYQNNSDTSYDHWVDTCAPPTASNSVWLYPFQSSPNLRLTAHQPAVQLVQSPDEGVLNASIYTPILEGSQKPSTTFHLSTHEDQPESSPTRCTSNPEYHQPITSPLRHDYHHSLTSFVTPSQSVTSEDAGGLCTPSPDQESKRSRFQVAINESSPLAVSNSDRGAASNFTSISLADYLAHSMTIEKKNPAQSNSFGQHRAPQLVTARRLATPSSFDQSLLTTGTFGDQREGTHSRSSHSDVQSSCSCTSADLAVNSFDYLSKRRAFLVDCLSNRYAELLQLLEDEWALTGQQPDNYVPYSEASLEAVELTKRFPIALPSSNTTTNNNNNTKDSSTTKDSPNGVENGRKLSSGNQTCIFDEPSLQRAMAPGLSAYGDHSMHLGRIKATGFPLSPSLLGSVGRQMSSSVRDLLAISRLSLEPEDSQPDVDKVTFDDESSETASVNVQEATRPRSGCSSSSLAPLQMPHPVYPGRRFGARHKHKQSHHHPNHGGKPRGVVSGFADKCRNRLGISHSLSDLSTTMSSPVLCSQPGLESGLFSWSTGATGKPAAEVDRGELAQTPPLPETVRRFSVATAASRSSFDDQDRVEAIAWTDMELATLRNIRAANKRFAEDLSRNKNTRRMYHQAYTNNDNTVRQLERQRELLKASSDYLNQGDTASLDTNQTYTNTADSTNNHADSSPAPIDADTPLTTACTDEPNNRNTTIVYCEDVTMVAPPSAADSSSSQANQSAGHHSTTASQCPVYPLLPYFSWCHTEKTRRPSRRPSILSLTASVATTPLRLFDKAWGTEDCTRVCATASPMTPGTPKFGRYISLPNSPQLSTRKCFLGMSPASSRRECQLTLVRAHENTEPFETTHNGDNKRATRHIPIIRQSVQSLSVEGQHEASGNQKNIECDKRCSSRKNGFNDAVQLSVSREKQQPSNRVAVQPFYVGQSSNSVNGNLESHSTAHNMNHHEGPRRTTGVVLTVNSRRGANADATDCASLANERGNSLFGNPNKSTLGHIGRTLSQEQGCVSLLTPALDYFESGSALPTANHSGRTCVRSPLHEWQQAFTCPKGSRTPNPCHRWITGQSDRSPIVETYVEEGGDSNAVALITAKITALNTEISQVSPTDFTLASRPITPDLLKSIRTDL